MNKEDVKEKVVNVLVETGCFTKEDKTSDSLEDLGMDSLDRVEATLLIEKEFGFSISDPSMESWKTVDDIIDYVTNKVSNATEPTKPN